MCEPGRSSRRGTVPTSAKTNYPDDVGFDPLGLKLKDPEKFDIMQAKKLRHGRLAMLGAAGNVLQELVGGKGIVEHFGF